MESNMKDKKQQAVPQSEAESFGIKRNPAVRAPRICLSEEEVIRIMRNEDAIKKKIGNLIDSMLCDCLLYTSPSPRDRQKSRMPSSA